MSPQQSRRSFGRQAALWRRRHDGRVRLRPAQQAATGDAVTELVAVDIGGTHARFALARMEGDRVRLEPETVLRTGDFAGLADAWGAFGKVLGRPLPRQAGIAVAAPVEGETVRLTNNHWTVARADLARQLDLGAFALVNDFAAVAHAVAVCGHEHLRHLCGPDRPLPADGVISVVGPGTGLGVAMLVRGGGGDGDRVVATEGGHIAFAPVDDFEDQLLARLRRRFGRVSVERVVAGPGLREICAVLGAGECGVDKALWGAALESSDPLAIDALERFCRSLGSVAGDLALSQGAQAVVIAGGLGLRLAPVLRQSGFAARFAEKGRFRSHLETLPVKVITHQQPGLLGAAAAFAAHMKRAPLQG
jgi:glucokinase